MKDKDVNKPIIEQPDEPELSEPGYFRQISPEKTSTDEYKGLYKYQTLDSICDRVIELEKQVADDEQKYSRYIEVPDGKDPVKVQEFASKLGVPENADDYKINFLDKADADKAAVSGFKKDLKAAMLTMAQANAVGNALFRFTKAGIEKAVEAARNRRDSFESTLTASYADIQIDADRQAAAKRDRESFDGFMAESGLKEMLEKNGMAYDPAFVKGIAAYARKHAGQNNPSPTPEGKDTQKKTAYGQYDSKDMERLYGRRHA